MAEKAKNKDYQAIKELSEKIDQAEGLEDEIGDLEEKTTKYKNVKFNSSHRFFPYGAMLEDLHSQAKKSTFLKRLFLSLYLLVIYGIMFALPAGAVYLLDMFGIYSYEPFLTDALHGVVILSIYAVLFIVFLFTVKKLPRSLRRGLDKRQKKRLLKKKKEKLGNALDESRRMIRQYEAGFGEKIKQAEERIEEAQKELRALEEEIEESTKVPQKYIKAIKRIRSYFEENRADSIKEALNLLVAEMREEAHFEELMAILGKHLSALETLEEEFATVEKHQRTLAEKTLQEDREKQRDEMKSEREKDKKRKERLRKQSRKGQKEERKRLRKKYG